MNKSQSNIGTGLCIKREILSTGCDQLASPPKFSLAFFFYKEMVGFILENKELFPQIDHPLSYVNHTSVAIIGNPLPEI